MWEAIQFAAHNKLSQLLLFIDENHKQLDGLTKDIMNPFDVKTKLEAFGFNTVRIKGNDEAVILETIKACHAVTDKPSCIVLDTIKGQGVKYFEDLNDNHHIRFTNESETELKAAIAVLEGQVKEESK